jgi:hypothetical protein
MTPAGWIIAGLSVALAASMAGNVLQFEAYLGQRDKTVKADAEAGKQREAADACTRGVDSLAKAATAQVAAAAAAAAAAKATAAKRAALADEILAAPASVPGDDCKSAQDRAARWLSRRVNP